MRPGARGRSRGPFVRQGPGALNIRPILGFVVRFAAIWALLLLAISLVPRLSEWAVAGTVESLRFILWSCGVGGEVYGASIFVGNISFRIVNDCTPLAPTAGLWAAMLAFPSPARWKFVGLLAGAAAIWVYNVARILALLPILALQWSFFPVIHVYLWQTLTLAAVGAIFVAWHRLQPATVDRA
jgi:exosortase/archaeosortase family protein